MALDFFMTEVARIIALTTFELDRNDVEWRVIVLAPRLVIERNSKNQDFAGGWGLVKTT